MAYDIWPELIDEKTTPRLTAVVRDHLGAAIPGSSLQSLKVWLFNRADGAVLGGRDGQTILGANGGAVDGSGNLTLDLAVADTAILNTAGEDETHLAEFEYTYNSGTRTARHTVEHTIRNLRKTT